MEDPSRPRSYAAELAAQRRARRWVIARDVAVMVVAIVVVVVGAALRFGPNPALPRARDLTTRLDAVYRGQRAGDLDVPADAATVAPGIVGARLDDGRWAVVGEVGDTCYAMWWASDGVRHVRTVPDLLACTPRTGGSFEGGTVARSGLSADEEADRAGWAGVLPAPTIVALWWIPLVLVAGAVALAAAVRIVVVLVTGRTSVRDLR